MVAFKLDGPSAGNVKRLLKQRHLAILWNQNYSHIFLVKHLAIV